MRSCLPASFDLLLEVVVTGHPSMIRAKNKSFLGTDIHLKKHSSFRASPQNLRQPYIHKKGTLNFPTRETTTSLASKLLSHHHASLLGSRRHRSTIKPKLVDRITPPENNSAPTYQASHFFSFDICLTMLTKEHIFGDSMSSNVSLEHSLAVESQ